MSKRIIGLVLAVAFIAAACGGIDREGSIKEIETSLGVDNATATCIFDESSKGISDDRMIELNDPSESLTPEETNIMATAFQTCGTSFSEVLSDDEIAEVAESMGITNDAARCVMDEMGAEFAALDASGAEADEALLDQLFATIDSCS